MVLTINLAAEQNQVLKILEHSYEEFERIQNLETMNYALHLQTQ